MVRSTALLSGLWEGNENEHGVAEAIVARVPDSSQREFEAALVAASLDPPGVFARLRKLRTLGTHELQPRATRRLRERYFDTPSRDLWSMHLAFREREVDGERLLALKGELGPRERLEIEGHEDEAAWERIESELRARGIRIAFDALGVIQEYDTTRERRALTSHDRTVAELALDEVRYRHDGREVRLHVVEVELEDVDAELGPLLVELQRTAPELRDWPYNKLATGAALATALDCGELGLSPEGTLSSEALDRLRRRLASGEG